MCAQNKLRHSCLPLLEIVDTLELMIEKALSLLLECHQCSLGKLVQIHPYQELSQNCW